MDAKEDPKTGFVTCLMHVLLYNEADDCVSLLELLQKLLQSIVANPEAEQRRKLNTTTPMFRTKIGAHEGSLDLLRSVGFLFASGGRDKLTMPSDIINLPLLNFAISTMEQVVPVVKSNAELKAEHLVSNPPPAPAAAPAVPAAPATPVLQASSGFIDYTVAALANLLAQHPQANHIAGLLSSVRYVRETAQNEISMLREQLRKQSEEFSMIRVQMEEFQSKMLQSKEEELSQAMSSEMARREQELYEIERRAKQQQEEYSLDRIRLEEEQNKRMAELQAKQDQAQSSLNGQYLPGEDEARRTGKFKEYDLRPGRMSEFTDIAEIHFRFAESQFLRLHGSDQFHVTRVDYIVNPALIAVFEAKQQELKDSHHPHKPILVCDVDPNTHPHDVVRHNFPMARNAAAVMPGFRDAGHIGRVFSSAKCEPLNRSRCLVFAKILPGREYRCRDHNLMTNGLQRNYDSHVSSSGTEFAIFDNRQILPCYIVHYLPGEAQLPDVNYDDNGLYDDIYFPAPHNPPPKKPIGKPYKPYKPYKPKPFKH